MAFSLVFNTEDLNQRDRVVLNINGKNTVLFLKLRWHKKISKWLMSIFDEDNQPVLRNIPLVSGYDYPAADLLKQFEHLNVGHASVMPSVNHPTTPIPSAGNFSPYSEWGLMWGLPDE